MATAVLEREELCRGDPVEPRNQVDEFKRRMLEWKNPVEFVNNMYSCHPGPKEGGEVDYFEEVFRS